MDINSLPIEIIDYIWTFDNTKYYNFDICIDNLKFFYNKYHTILNLYRIGRGNRYNWWLKEYGNFPGKSILKKIREHNAFERVKNND